MVRSVFAAPMALALFMITGAQVAAAAQQTFVASNGNDADPCSLTMPCRSFGAAVAQTSAGGEVVVLDSAGYGPVTITQSVSIIAPPGVYAGISVASGTGILVNAGLGDVVLSGLTIVGIGGVFGIQFEAANSLRIDRISISRFGGIGLNAQLTNSGTLVVQRSELFANGQGMAAYTSAGTLTLEIDGVRFDQNMGAGANFGSHVVGVISGSSFSKNDRGVYAAIGGPAGSAFSLSFRNCIFSRNTDGILAGGDPLIASVVSLSDSEVSDNTGVGLRGLADSAIAVSNATVTRNSVGIQADAGSAVRSFQDNRLYGNATDGAFTSTLPKQ